MPPRRRPALRLLTPTGWICLAMVVGGIATTALTLGHAFH